MIGRKSFMVYFNQIFGAVTGMIGIFFVFKFMPNPEYNYGIVNFALAFAGLFNFISNLFDNAHVKRLSEGRDEGECMGTYISLLSISVAVMLLLAFGAILSWKYILGRGFESKTHETVLYIILGFVTIKNIGKLGVSTFQGRSEIAKREVIRFMDYNVPTIFIVYVAITGGQAIEYASTYLAGGLLMSIAALYFLKDVKIKKPNWSLAKDYWKFGLPSMLTKITNKLGNRLDIVMVQIFWSSVNVGYYAVSLRFSAMVIGISSAVSVVIFPKISEYHSTSSWEEIKGVVKESSRYLSMVSIPVIAFLIVFPEETIHILLKDRALPAAPLFRIMGITAFFAVVSGPFKSVFGGIDKPKLGAKIVIVANILNFSLNVLLIPPSLFGIELLGLREIGAALATMVSSIFLFIFVLYYSNREAGVTMYPRTVLHVLAGAVTGFTLFTIEDKIYPILRFYDLGIYAVLFLGMYTFILYLMREFTKEEWGYIMESLHPGGMYEYIKDEIKGEDK